MNFNMKVFICGGGSGVQTQDAYNKLDELINHSKPLLYIPLAMDYTEYDRCYEWITEELRALNICKIDMVRSARELEEKNLNEYCAIFIGGGNTYKLLFELKLSGSFDKIKDFIFNDGIVFGGSAGAIIMGHDISSCECDDENKVGLINTKGIDVLNGISVLCHYTNREERKNIANTEFLKRKSYEMNIIALPEEDTIFVNDKKIQVMGSRPYYIFSNGECKEGRSKLRFWSINFEMIYSKNVMCNKIGIR